MCVIGSMVEGRAEVESFPLLLRKILSSFGIYDVQVVRPFRVSRSKVTKKGELERSLRQLIADRQNVSFIVVLLDSDDDCPAELGPSLLHRCRESTDLPVTVVLAKREFEAWFLAAKESLRGFRGISADACAPQNAEDIRGAKELLSQNMIGRRYIEVDDQPAFVDRMELDLASKRCQSFEKLVRDLRALQSK
jgi:hypothetical protein